MFLVYIVPGVLKIRILQQRPVYSDRIDSQPVQIRVCGGADGDGERHD